MEIEDVRSLKKGSVVKYSRESKEKFVVESIGSTINKNHQGIEYRWMTVRRFSNGVRSVVASCCLKKN